MTGRAYVTGFGTSVRLGDRPLCSTGNSASLDRTIDGVAQWDRRIWAAERIALCWNACRHLTDEQLREASSSPAPFAAGGAA